jgi:hypothetical protein
LAHQTRLSHIGGPPPLPRRAAFGGGVNSQNDVPPNDLFARFGTTPLPQKLPIAPIFIADSVSLAVSREKDGKLRIVYAGWDNANVVQPDGYGQARGGWEADLTPPSREALPPPKN